MKLISVFLLGILCISSTTYAGLFGKKPPQKKSAQESSAPPAAPPACDPLLDVSTPKSLKAESAALKPEPALKKISGPGIGGALTLVTQVGTGGLAQAATWRNKKGPLAEAEAKAYFDFVAQQVEEKTGLAGPLYRHGICWVDVKGKGVSAEQAADYRTVLHSIYPHVPAYYSYVYKGWRNTLEDEFDSYYAQAYVKTRGLTFDHWPKEFHDQRNSAVKVSYSSSTYGSDYVGMYSSTLSREEEEKRQARLKEEKAHHTQGIHQLLQEPGSARLVWDEITARWVKEHIYKSDAVSLLLGNSYTVVTPELESQISELAGSFLKKGHLIIYDADSALGPLIGKVAQGRAIGISGVRPTDWDFKNLDTAFSREGVVWIENPYLRMSVFEVRSGKIWSDDSPKVWITPDSVTGLGLLMEGDVGTVLDPEEHWMRRYQEWAEESKTLGPGVSANRFSKVESRSIQNVLRAALKSSDSSRAPPLSFQIQLDSFLESLISYYVEDIFNRPQRWIEAHKNPLPGGAVVFGSGSLDSRYVDLVYQTVRQLAQHGVPIATGGSGGFMEVANTAAYDAGAESIGIPMGYGFTVKNESKASSEVHTLTVTARGYEGRIPLLLENRQLILVAPGGSGTMRELATTLVMLGAHPQASVQLAFLSSTYYGMLFSLLNRQATPDYLRERLKLIHSPEDLALVFSKLVTMKGFDEVLWRSSKPVQPRNSNQAFPLKPVQNIPITTSSHDDRDLWGDWGGGD